VAVLSAIDADAFYDYVMTRAPEFSAGRRQADVDIAGGELGTPLADVGSELDDDGEVG